MAIVPTYDFTWQQGEDGEIRLICKAGDPPVPVNLAGYSLRMDVRDADGTQLFIINSNDISNEYLEASGNADNEVTLGTDGTISIIVPRAASLGSGPLVGEIGRVLQYDIFLRDTQNHQKKILRGTITLEASQTRWM